MNEADCPNLPYTDLDQILTDPPGHGVAYVIRHAERTPLFERETIFSADLTEKGWEDARLFGKRMGAVFGISAVFSSPVERCIHTASAILEGAGISLQPQTRWWLFSPFLEAQKRSNSHTISINSTTVPERGVECLDKNRLRTVVERIKIPPSPGMINLYITHDSTVTPLLGLLLDLDTVWVSQYPKYLQGFVLTRDGTGNPSLFRP